VKVLLVTEKTKAVDQSDKTEIMIAMKMRNENMGDPASPDLVTDHLYLCAFAAIDKKKIIVHRHNLAGGVAIKCGYCRVIAENGNSEHAEGKNL
jgi:hypothetical protein